MGGFGIHLSRRRTALEDSNSKKLEGRAAIPPSPFTPGPPPQGSTVRCTTNQHRSERRTGRRVSRTVSGLRAGCCFRPGEEVEAFQSMTCPARFRIAVKRASRAGEPSFFKESRRLFTWYPWLQDYPEAGSGPQADGGGAAALDISASRRTFSFSLSAHCRSLPPRPTLRA